MKKIIKECVEESIRVKQRTLEENLEVLICVVKEITKSLKKGGKVILFGNGGSAADSQHIAAELIGRFKRNRKAFAAIALTTDTSVLTSLSNDYSYNIIFARQIEGLAKRADVAWAFSTSGNSSNVIEGIKKAKAMGLKTVSFTGHAGGELASLSDWNLNVSSEDTARIQESHSCFAHIICELLEESLTK